MARIIRAKQTLSNTELKITSDLPGYKKATLELSVRGNLRGYTEIIGKVGKDLDGAKDDIHLFVDADPGRLDLDGVSATLEDGVLTVTLPLASAYSMKEVTIV
jgi:HSP20 family molecular chaperone IbpA